MQAAGMQRLTGSRQQLALPAAAPGVANGRVQRRALVTMAYSSASFQATVRPYTLRKGDTIDSIAKKRDVTVEQLKLLNPEINLSKIAEGNTILLPSGRLSSRDKEILSGIGAGYRLYPVRAGETIDDIISKRRITLDELASLNPGVKFEKLSEGFVLKLPANKFTVREREMLIGSGILPAEFFEVATNPFVIGVGALLGVCGFVLAWMKFHRDEDLDTV